MSKRQALIDKYAAALQEKCKVTPDMALLTKVTIGCGPAIYDADAEDKYERNQGARFEVEPVTDEAVIAQLHEETPEIPQGATFVHIVEVLPLG